MTANVNTVHLGDGRVVTTSYGIPVAVFVPAEGHFKSDRTYSSTSSRHANLYARQTGGEATIVPHDRFKDLVAPLACPI